MNKDLHSHDDERLWSLDGHYFNAASLRDLLETHADLEAGDVVFVGRPVPVQPLTYVNARLIVEQLSEQARDDCGEAAEEWPQVTPEAERELDRYLADWIHRHCPVTFSRVHEVAEHLISAADIDAARPQTH